MQRIYRGTSNKLLMQLTTRFLLVAVLPLLVTLVPTYMVAQQTLVEQVHEKLAAKASSRKAMLEEFLHVLGRRGELRAATHQVGESVQALEQYAQVTSTAVGFDTQSAAYSALYEKVYARMVQVAKADEFSDVYLISADTGVVWFNYSREPDLGTNLRTGPYKNTAFAKAFERAVAKGETAYADFEWFDPAKKACMFVANPVFDDKGAVKAVTVVELDSTAVEAVTVDRTGLGQSGEAYVVGRDLKMRTQSHLTTTSTVLKTIVDTQAVRAALAGKSGVLEGLDYRGVPVISHHSPLGLQAKTGLDWVLVVEVDSAEALVDIQKLRFRLQVTSILAVLIMVGFAYWLSRQLAGPLLEISLVASRVAEGDLSVSTDVSRGNDEVAVIVRSIQDMVARLRLQTSAIGGNTATISAATSQLTTSMTELASSVTETATAVAETSVTTEEVKQTSLLASQKAQIVADSSRRAVAVAADSQAATDKTLVDLARLQEQINAVAARMYRLSEQTRSVSAVVNVVDDISDQANLLAVNAAIEAAKAGEYGRGFAVVAQEIRELAERTRRATTEIPAILGEIERAAGAAVSATEVGTRSIEVVVAQSVAAGQLVRDLSAILGEAAQSATQILVSGQQQVVGMNQVAGAMDSIRIASAQNADSARGMQDTTRALEGVGKDLQAIIEWYKV